MWHIAAEKGRKRNVVLVNKTAAKRDCYENSNEDNCRRCVTSLLIVGRFVRFCFFYRFLVESMKFLAPGFDETFPRSS
jgi:hypothetical protein